MRPGTQFDVDSKCRIMLQNGIVLNKIFACGIGYPVRTNDGKTIMAHQMDKKKQQEQKANNPRADGYSLYTNIVGDILLKNILPKESKLKGMSHKTYPIQKVSAPPSNY